MHIIISEILHFTDHKLLNGSVFFCPKTKLKLLFWTYVFLAINRESCSELDFLKLGLTGHSDILHYYFTMFFLGLKHYAVNMRLMSEHITGSHSHTGA